MKIKKLLPLLCVIMCLLINNAFAQKKVVIMGSSTAAGFGATSYPLSWAGKLEGYFNTNAGDGIDTTFYNIAAGGYNTYQELPSGYVPPMGRPVSDPLHNVTKALSYNPDIVIINLPSNDVGGGYTITETIDNLIMMYNAITASGALCYITTTQPRNDYSISQRQSLFDTKDAINTQFGVFAINFWDDLVTADGLNMLRDDRRDPASAIHPNDIGHDFLFGRVRDKNIFSLVALPLKITCFSAQMKNNTISIKWHTELEEPNTLFEIERSANGIDFENALSLNIPKACQSADYSVIDKNPFQGKSFYRIKVTESAHFHYSNTISVTNKSNALKIMKLYKDNSSGNLIADVSTQKEENVFIAVYNTMGVMMQQKKQHLCISSTKIILPLANLTAGQYFFKISTDENNYSIKAFIK